MNPVEKIKELNNRTDCLSDFEKSFVQDNSARIEKWGDETRFSEKQSALVDQIYKERVEEGKPAKATAGEAEA
jgi:hypothetical protein